MSDDLIRQLVFDLRAVQRLESPARRSARFMLPAIVVMVANTWIIGIRPDVATRLHDVTYMGETALLLALFGGAVLAAFSSGVPGEPLRAKVRLLLVAALSWLVLTVAGYAAAPAAMSIPSGVACLRRTVLLAIVPAGALFSMLRKASPLESGVSGSLVLTAAGALALLGTRLLCTKDDGAHVLVWHALPLAALSLLGSLLGRAWLGRAECRS